MITRHGWTAIVAAVACFAIGRVFGLIELFVVGVVDQTHPSDAAELPDAIAPGDQRVLDRGRERRRA